MKQVERGWCWSRPVVNVSMFDGDGQDSFNDCCEERPVCIVYVWVWYICVCWCLKTIIMKNKRQWSWIDTIECWQNLRKLCSITNRSVDRNQMWQFQVFKYRNNDWKETKKKKKKIDSSLGWHVWMRWEWYSSVIFDAKKKREKVFDFSVKSPTPRFLILAPWFHVLPIGGEDACFCLFNCCCCRNGHPTCSCYCLHSICVVNLNCFPMLIAIL